MSVKSRCYAAVDKDQRRLGLLKSIDANIDLGHVFNIEAFTRLIDNTRVAVESHNTLLSNLEESRQTIDQMNKALSEMSERMLSGIATVYGKKSMEYSKAGGSNRRRGKKSTAQVSVVDGASATQPTQTTIAPEPINNNGKTPVL